MELRDTCDKLRSY